MKRVSGIMYAAAVLLLLVMTGCTSAPSSSGMEERGADTPENGEVLPPDGATSDGEMSPEADEAAADEPTADEAGEPGAGTEPSDANTGNDAGNNAGIPVNEGKYDISFVYHNGFYGYDLEGTWSDVTILPKATNLGSEINGLEILYDATSETFDEMDADGSGDLDQEEWGEIEMDFPLKDYDSDGDGAVSAVDFLGFSQMLGGMEVYAMDYYISQPTMEGYVIELNGGDSPVGLQILRASSAGFTGGYGVYFPEGTIFIQLTSDFLIYMPEAGDMDVTVAFDYPSMDMYIEDGVEVKSSYSHGALGFTSVVDSNEFNALFSGQEFSLHYDAYYESKVVGTYDLTITPRKH